MTCPRCAAELTPAEIATLYAGLRKVKAGWPKGKPRKDPRDLRARKRGNILARLAK